LGKPVSRGGGGLGSRGLWGFDQGEETTHELCDCGFLSSLPEILGQGLEGNDFGWEWGPGGTFGGWGGEPCSPGAPAGKKRGGGGGRGWGVGLGFFSRRGGPGLFVFFPGTLQIFPRQRGGPRPPGGGGTARKFFGVGAQKNWGPKSVFFLRDWGGSGAVIWGRGRGGDAQGRIRLPWGGGPPPKGGGGTSHFVWAGGGPLPGSGPGLGRPPPKKKKRAAGPRGGSQGGAV